MKPNKIKELVNIPYNGKTPLDISKSEKMTQVLLSLGAMSAVSLPKEIVEASIRHEPKVNEEVFFIEDAKVNSAKLQVTNPIKSAYDIDKKDEIDYFNVFEPIEEYNDNEIETQKSALVNKPSDDNVVILDDKTKTALLDEPLDINSRIDKKNKFNSNYYRNFTLIQLTENDPQLLDDIIGFDDVKKELKENVVIPTNMKNASILLRENNIDIPNAILINSTKGSSLELVKALAGETDMPVIQLFHQEEIKPLMNNAEKLYKKDGIKTIVLMQGLDKFLNSQSSEQERNNFINTIKKCGRKGVLFIATTNSKEDLNCDWINSGLFDKILEMKNPTFNDRKNFIKKQFDDKNKFFSKINNQNNIEEIAELTDNFSLEDINRILKESARCSIANGSSDVSIEIIKDKIKCHAKELDITPIDENNKTAIYDKKNFLRTPFVKGEMTSLDEIGGMDDVKEQLRAYIKTYKNLDKLKEILGNSANPDGLIFYGPPGNAKTVSAKIMARELGLPFYETRLSEIASPYIHEVSRRIKEQANQLTNKYNQTGEMSVWFLDEFDSLGNARENNSEHRKEVTNTLLQEMNNAAEKGYIIIAVTNDINSIDPALKRRGRLGNWIEFRNPNEQDRIDIITKNLSKTDFTKKYIEDKELMKFLVNEFDGASGASIILTINDAKKNVLLNNLDFKTAINEVIQVNTEREMAEFCNKIGLKEHKYSDTDFKSLDELGRMEEVKNKRKKNI